MEQTEYKGSLHSFEYKDVQISMEEFTYTFLKYDVLCYKSSSSDQSEVYLQISKDLKIPVNRVSIWVTLFRTELYQRMLHIAIAKSPYEKLAMQPKWVQDAEAKLNWLPGAILQVEFRRAKPSEINPNSLLRLLVAFSKRCRNLCAATFYGDIKRSLRLGCPTSEVHTMWVYAQSVSLQLVQSHIRRGDVPSPQLPVSDTNWLVADLVILFTDVEVQRLVTNESLAVLEECKTLMILLQLVHKFGVEKAITKAERASKWTQVYNEYIQDGRKTSIVVLQRRWHELKLQARMRFCELKNNTPDGILPEWIHMELAKKFPMVLTATLTTWGWQVAHGEIILEPIKEIPNQEIIETIKSRDELKVKSADDIDDDVLLIEKPVEVIAVDTDDENSDTVDDALIKTSSEITTGNLKKTSKTGLHEPKDSDESSLEDIEDCKNIEIEIFPDHIYDSIVANYVNGNVISTDIAHTDSIPPKEPRPPDSIVKAKDLIIAEILSNVKLEKESEISDTIDNAESVPVLDKLQSLDPNKLKVQIIFDSDSDENTMQNTDLIKPDRSEPSVKEGEAFVCEKNNKLQSLIQSTFHQRLRFDDEKDTEDTCDVKNDTLQVDSKLLMGTKVELVRLHDTACWKKYSVKRKYIKVDKINLSELQTAGDRAKYLAELREERRRVALAGDLLDKNRTNVTPDDDTDNDTRRRTKASRISKANQITRNSKKFGDWPFMSDSSTDEEMPLSAIYRPLQRAAAWKRKAADAVGSPADDANPPRKSKRVELHDIEEVRRTNQNLLTAEVAPITAKREKRNSSSIDFDYVIEDVLRKPKTRDLDHNRISRKDLKKVMEKLPAVNMNRKWSETVGESDFCCLARRDHSVNDTRRRISINLPLINLHVHETDACNCCCAHLLDEDKNKQKLSLEINTLDDLMKNILKVRLHIANAQSQQVDKPVKETEKEVSKAKPKSKSITKPKRKKAKTPAPPIEDFEPDISIGEWEKLKKLHEPYFKINSHFSKKQPKKRPEKLPEKKEEGKSDPILPDTLTQTSGPVANEVTVQENTGQVQAQDVPSKNCGFVIFEHKPEDTTVSPTPKACANSPTTTGAQKNVKKYTPFIIKQNTDSKQCDGKSSYVHVLTKSDLQSCNEVNKHLLPADTPRAHTLFNQSKCINLNGDTQVMVTNNETKKIINLLFFKGKMIPVEKKLGEIADKPVAVPNSKSGNLLPKLKDKSLEHLKSDSDILDRDDSGPYLYRSQAPKITLDMLISLCAPSLPIVLRSDAARPLLKLPGGYVIIAEGILPCTSPTYWTMAPYRNVARVFLDNNKNINSSLKFVGKELLENNDKESFSSTLMNSASNAAPTEKGDTDEHESNNDVIVLDSDSNDEKEAHKHLNNANSNLKSEEQQDFTNFIKITEVVGGVRDFTDVEHKVKSELAVSNAETECDVNNKVQQTKSILSPTPEMDDKSTNVACEVEKNQSDYSNNIDSVSAAQSTESVNCNLVKEIEIVGRDVNHDKGCPQNIMSSTNDAEVVKIDSDSNASNNSEPLPAANKVEINNAVDDDDDDDDTDNRLVINENYSDSTSIHNKSDDSDIRSSVSSNNDVQLNDTPEITQNSKDDDVIVELSDDDNKLVIDNCVLKDLTTEVGKENEDKEMSTESSDKVSYAKGDISSEQLASNQAGSSLKVFTALSECENFREIVATVKELYLMRRFCGTITPILRVQRDGAEGIASSVPKETLVVLARLLNGNIEATSESPSVTTFPVIDITED